MNEYFYKPPPPPPGARATASGSRGGGRAGRGGGAAGRGGSGSLSTAAAAAHPYQRPTEKPRRSERPEDASDEDEGTVVPTIQVDTSDVDKWIAERRKNWPSNKRVAEKEAEKERLRTLRTEHERLVGKDSRKQTNKPLCKYFVRGKCGNGDKCKFSHEKKAQDASYKRFGPPKKVSLFTRLVQNDMDKENDKVLDFIVYLNQRGVI